MLTAHVQSLMKPKLIHRWNLSIKEAHSLQEELAKKVITHDEFHGPVNLVAGVDVAYARGSDIAFAAVVVLDAITFELVEAKTATDSARFPYVPGLFSFREVPSLLEALAQLTVTPDLIVCDAHGLSHPRRFGLACHLGLILDVPTIGCAKTKLIGEHDPLPQTRAAAAPMYAGTELVGCALCTQNMIKPVYVSVGHKISLRSACEWILKLSPSYRLPETTRKANEMVNILRKSASP